LRKRSVLWLSLVLPLFFTVLTVGVDAQPTEVSVEPSSVTVPPPGIGLNFTVKVWVNNVMDLVGWELVVFWNNTLLNCTSAVDTPPAVWGDDYFTAGLGINQTYNATHGMYWKGVFALGSAPSFNGSVSILTLNFTAMAIGGSSPIRLDVRDFDPTYPYPVKLVYYNMSRIPCTAVDGTVTVVPEFPVSLIMPLFMVVTMVVVILGKAFWLRKRRSF